MRSIHADSALPSVTNARLTSSQPAHKIKSGRNHPAPTTKLPPRSTAGQQILDLLIGVRIPGGQPTLLQHPLLAVLYPVGTLTNDYSYPPVLPGNGLALGASAAWGNAFALPSSLKWNERRDLYPEGVASGDPDSSSVLLWTRHAPNARNLTVEVAEDKSFRRVIATAPRTDFGGIGLDLPRFGGRPQARAACIGIASPTLRALAAALAAPSRRPPDDDPRPVRFAFVSCQNVNQGAQNAYRRMIFEDERAAEKDRLGFVLHLGDFIYEIVWYPEDRPQGMYDRRLRDIVRYEHGEKIEDFHIPTTLDDYRAVYRAYLHDPDLQDARARWPFVNMWDNHEFSWQGWQSMQKFDGNRGPHKPAKLPPIRPFSNTGLREWRSRVGHRLICSIRPKLSIRRSHNFDDHGLGQEPNNLTAIEA